MPNQEQFIGTRQQFVEHLGLGERPQGDILTDPSECVILAHHFLLDLGRAGENHAKLEASQSIRCRILFRVECSGWILGGDALEFIDEHEDTSITQF